MRTTAAFVFDIDGVLLRHPRVLPRVSDALAELRTRAAPMVFMTNGGGTTEAARAKQLSRQLSMPVIPEQVCLCHTPMQRAIRDMLSHGDACRAFLAVGRRGEAARAAAASYGIPDHLLFTPDDVHAALPRSYGDALPSPPDGEPRTLPPFGALLLLIDPTDYRRELQLCADVLLATGGVLGTRRAPGTAQDVACLNACADLEWVSDYNQPRLGAGAFKLALEGVYRELSGGMELQQTLFGKPQPVNYAHVDDMLAGLAANLGYDGVHHVYAVGDNPRTDIAGANGAGEHWTSMLVRTGIFDGAAEENDAQDPADYVVDDCWSAVQTAIELERCQLGNNKT